MARKCPKCQSDNPGTATFCADCGTQLQSPGDIEVTETIEAPKEELTTGSTFAGRYRIIEELGKGGMGKVYKVHDTKINEKIALKLIKPEIAKDKKTIERFSNEMKLARRIRHKNICQMFECFGSAKFGQMSAFLKLQIICDNLKLGGMHDNQEKVQEFA